jgi:hypothetical protein
MMSSYLQPKTTNPFPDGLTLTQFLQMVLVGISGLPGANVRPKWQVQQPTNPPVDVNWIGFGVDISSPDANAYFASDATDPLKSNMQRHVGIELGCSIYGPDALETYDILVDGFQVPQNRYALFDNDMGFVEVLPGRKVPELINELWYNRVETSIILRRERERSYGVPRILSASGVIYTDFKDYSLDWTVSP